MLVAILLAIASQVAEVPAVTMPAPAVSMDMVDTPLGDVLTAYSSSTGQQLDISEVPKDALAKPITFTYAGDAENFLSLLHNLTDLDFTVRASGGATVLAVTPERLIPWHAVGRGAVVAVVACAIVYAYRVSRS